MQTFRFGETVLVPFPFTDMPVAKRRPAVVLSAQDFNLANGQSILGMITSARSSSWAGDITIADLDAAGMPHPSVIRFKLFTLPNELIIRRLGGLSQADLATLQDRTGHIFGA